jgi:phenylacetate-coenzyme A ligase PaaK-like adenylate-forming protein
MTPRKIQRNKMKSTFAKVKDIWKAYAKREREEKREPKTFEKWLGLAA